VQSRFDVQCTPHSLSLNWIPSHFTFAADTDGVALAIAALGPVAEATGATLVAAGAVAEAAFAVAEAVGDSSDLLDPLHARRAINRRPTATVTSSRSIERRMHQECDRKGSRH
jgi:hypothetical protein